jgi:hypothetical protein
MRALVTLLTICIVIFAYLHVVFQLKKNNDLEVLELNSTDKVQLEEVCDARQPTVFHGINNDMIDRCNIESIKTEYAAFDLKIMDNDPSENIPLPLSLKESLELFRKDDESKYWTQNNNDFLEDTSLSKVYASNDELLRPYMVSNIEYDMIMGSDGATTRLAYEVNYRNYFLVTEGSVSLKLSPPKNTKYFHSVKNYELQEYYSDMNPWKPEEADVTNFSKAKFLDVTLQKGQIIYIPAYWWYSIKLGKDACVAVFKYRTYMNTIAILPDILIGVLQRQNTKTKTIQEYNLNPEIV